MNSSAAESLYQKLTGFAEEYENAQCYWVAIWAKESYSSRWEGRINGKDYSHPRVYKISGDRFYELLSGRKNALFELYNVLPSAIDHFMSSTKKKESKAPTAIIEINEEAQKSGRDILRQIAFDNFNYYSGFDALE